MSNRRPERRWWAISPWTARRIESTIRAGRSAGRRGSNSIRMSAKVVPMNWRQLGS